MLAAALSCGANLRAATPATVMGSPAATYQVETVAFSDSKEAGMLLKAYTILATGDHDYNGHRAKAMAAVKAAAKRLNVDLGGDDKYREKQFLSDDKLREAQGLISGVLGAAEVKDQPVIAKHLNSAIHQIDLALTIK
jgi:hypothetical protein